MFVKHKPKVIVFLALFITIIFYSCSSDPEIEYCNITWHLNGGTWSDDTPPVQIEKDTVLTKPENPTREGFLFGGWYTNNRFSIAYNFSAKVTSNLNLYAKWTDADVDTDPQNKLTVTTGANSGTGSLRYAITNASAGDTITIADNVKTIYLESRITIDKNLIINGNGVTITRAPSWTTASSTSQFMYIYSSSGTINVSIRRIWFKDGRATMDGGAIYNNGESVTLESCIFSGNRSTTSAGAIENNGIMIIQGCTFFDNHCEAYGGVIYHNSGIGKILTLSGNIFYGNTAGINRLIIAAYGTMDSRGYNLVDVPLGTSSSQAGWTAAAGDVSINTQPFSTKNFKLFPYSDALGVIANLPSGYPTLDFYGNEIPQTNASAGAVQEAVSGSGWMLGWSANNSNAGEINITNGAPDEDGLYSGTITLTAAENSGYTFLHWLVNGEVETDNPLNLTMDSHTIVKAVYIRNVYVTSNANSGAGTFREALTDAQDEDVIIFNLTGPNNVIQLTSALPDVNKNITIEGNGATLTRSASWTTINTTSQLLRINSNVNVKISRMWFKDGRAENYGAAIRTSGRVLLESCIFSSNWTVYGTGNGGAIFNEGILDINGCTFFDNYSSNRGGAVYCYNGTVNLTGNIFFLNGTNTSNYTIYSLLSTITSGGYNIVDNPLGTASTQSGWSPATGDKSVTSLPVSNVTFKLHSDSEASGVITTLPDGYPAKDFYGNDIPQTNAAAGAVQDTVTGDGYCIIVRKNYDDRGTIQINGASDTDGLYTGQVTLTANSTSGFAFSYWIIDGTMVSGNTIELTMDDHKSIYAVFGRLINVTSSSDTAGSAYIPTLRYALTNAETDDIINLDLIFKTIELNSALPQITKRIKIEGNGVTLTRSSSWTSTSSTSQLLRISSAAKEVIINRVHFKNGKATDYGAAIDNRGELILTNCIFSGNQTTGSLAYGGAIYNSGILIVTGCTFYNNSASGTYAYGGAIYNSTSAQSALVANIFNMNSAYSRPVIAGTVTESIANVTDVAGGTGTNQSGLIDIFDGGNDLNLPEILIIDTTTFAPIEEAKDFITNLNNFYSVFLKYDFYGNERTWPGAPGAVK